MSKSLKFLVLSVLMGVSFANKASEYTEALKAVSASTQQEELQELVKDYSQLNQTDKRNFYLLVALENAQHALALKGGIYFYVLLLVENEQRADALKYGRHFAMQKETEKYNALEKDKQKLLKDFSNDIIKRYQSFIKKHFLNILETAREKKDSASFVAAGRRLVSFNSELLKSLKKELAVQIPSKL